MVVSAVNSLSNRTKLTIGKPPDAKSCFLTLIEVLLEYGFEVIWQRITLSNSTFAKTRAGRTFLPLRLENGNETKTTVPVANSPMLHPPPFYSNPKALFLKAEPFLPEI